MKMKTIASLLAALLAFSAQPSFSQETKETSSVTTELRELVAKVQTKLRAGDNTEEKLTAELKEFDDILARHKNEKTDEVAQVLLMKAALYSQVFENEAKGKELFEQLKRDFPNSKQVAMLKKQEESEKLRASLAKGAAFPDFDVKDTEGNPLSLAKYKGKVVLIDFWATWCGPCVAELPHVLEAYEKHHKNGFEIIGISLDSSKTKLDTFVKDKKMTWPQYFDGKGWENELAQKYGINSIPATYLIDREGKIIATDLRGDALEKAVAEALAKK
jgi:Peroxiredoxin